MKTAVKILLCLAAGACIASFTLLNPLRSARAAEEEPEVQHIPVVLNNVLTNEMSDIMELEGLDAEFRHFLRQWQIHGASLAIMRNDSLVYAKGYGDADLDHRPVTPGTISGWLLSLNSSLQLGS